MNKMNKEDLELHSKIAKRLCKTVKGLKVVSVMFVLDKLTGVELDLHGLLSANDFDFFHDMEGIFNHIDYSTGELRHCFLPRYVKRAGLAKNSEVV